MDDSLRDMKPTMKCPNCAGTGRSSLPEALQETFDAIPKRGRQFRASDIQALVPGAVTVNAINNRLEALRDLGFLQRERWGKYWLYNRA